MKKIITANRIYIALATVEVLLVVAALIITLYQAYDHYMTTPVYKDPPKAYGVTESTPNYYYYKSNDSSSSSSSSGANFPRTYKSNSSYRSYDRGYDDVYNDYDYDWDRYRSDSDYADGVDDAMEDDDW